MPLNPSRGIALSERMRDFLLRMKRSGLERSVPNISWETAGYIIERVQAINPRSILEIGPANGFSTMMLRLAAPEAHIVSVEFSRHAFEELRHNITTYDHIQHDEPDTDMPAEMPPRVPRSTDACHVGDFSLYFGDARDVLEYFREGGSDIVCPHPETHIPRIDAERFQVIFIDGAFRMTREFFDRSVPLLAPGGIIILDDAIKFRWKMNGFYEYLDGLGAQYEVIQTDPDDGIMVITGADTLDSKKGG